MGRDDEDAALARQQELEQREQADMLHRDARAWLDQFAPLTKQLEEIRNGKHGILEPGQGD